MPRQASGNSWPSASIAKAGSLDEIRRSHETFDPLRDPTMRPTPFQAYLRIQIGCDKFCTYCVVPMTRGPEQGRPPDEILREAHTLAEQGCVEITLLGQTVNSYTYDAHGRTTRLADLLIRLHDIAGIQRLKFVTNFPQGHDTTAAGDGARSPQVLTVSARAAAKWLERRVAPHETRLHGRGVPGDDAPDWGHDSECGRLERFHRGLLR